MPAASMAVANSMFSLRNPYPGCTATTPCRHIEEAMLKPTSSRQADPCRDIVLGVCRYF